MRSWPPGSGRARRGCRGSGGVLGGFGPGHAFVGAGEVVVHAVPGMVQRDLGEKVHVHSDAELGEERGQQAEGPGSCGVGSAAWSGPALAWRLVYGVPRWAVQPE